MEEIKEGDYIRTIKGNICKVLRVREKHRFMTSSGHPSVTPERYFVDNNKQYSISKPYVKKHSKNIIDLIEVGDYVNGILVTGKESTLLWTEIKGIDRSGYHIPISQYGENIKSIVTKEQFENIEYKVEER